MDATVAILLVVMMCILGVMIAYNSAVTINRLDRVADCIVEMQTLLGEMGNSADSQFREDWESPGKGRE